MRRKTETGAKGITALFQKQKKKKMSLNYACSCASKHNYPLPSERKMPDCVLSKQKELKRQKLIFLKVRNGRLLFFFSLHDCYTHNEFKKLLWKK